MGLYTTKEITSDIENRSEENKQNALTVEVKLWDTEKRIRCSIRQPLGITKLKKKNVWGGSIQKDKISDDFKEFP